MSKRLLVHKMSLLLKMKSKSLFESDKYHDNSPQTVLAADVNCEIAVWQKDGFSSWDNSARRRAQAGGL